MSNRPLIVTLISSLTLLTGVLLLLLAITIGGISFLLTVGNIDPMLQQIINFLLAGGAIIIGITGVIFLIWGYCLLRGNKYAYYAYIILSGLGLAVSALQSFTTSGAIGILAIIVPLSMLTYFVRRDVQRFYHIKLPFGWGK